MAIIFIVTGGVFGFVAALTALVLGAGVGAALAVWTGTGMAFAALGLTLVLLPRRGQAPARQVA